MLTQHYWRCQWNWAKANFCQMTTTTVSTMPSSSVRRERLNRFSAGCILLFLLGLVIAVGPVRAAKIDDAITVLYATLKPAEDNWVVDAAFGVRLNRTQEEALKKGIPLYFVTEFELQRVRSWWFNEDLATTSRIGRLNYSPLTRRYQVETVDNFKAYDTLPEALAELGRIEKWIINPNKKLKAGNSYLAAIRMRLDLGLLSKPLQINALATGKWEVEGNWHEWEVTP